ncbi:unnamed protein product [Ixodes pacificus]
MQLLMMFVICSSLFTSTGQNGSPAVALTYLILSLRRVTMSSRAWR